MAIDPSFMQLICLVMTFIIASKMNAFDTTIQE